MSEQLIDDQITFDKDQKATIVLIYPIDQLTSLKIRRPKARDQIAVEKIQGKTPPEKEIILFSNLCEVTQEDILNLDMKDYLRLQDVYKSFLS